MTVKAEYVEASILGCSVIENRVLVSRSPVELEVKSLFRKMTSEILAKKQLRTLIVDCHVEYSNISAGQELMV